MIKTAIFILACLVGCTLAGGQSFPDSLTAKHQLIAGTNLYLVPPPTFGASVNFKGFQNPDDQTSMIMVMEIPGPFAEVTEGFDPEVMHSRGMELREKDEIRIGNFDGYLLTIDQVANGLVFSKHLLVYGDESATTLINGVFLQDSVRLGRQVKSSILSAFVDTNLVPDPRAALRFTLDEKAGDLQFFSVVGNGMLLNRDLKTPTESPDKATLIADKSFAQVEIGDQKTFCINRLQQFPGNFSLLEEKGLRPVEIDALPGYELFAASNEDESEEVYQVILFDESGDYYIFVGSYLKGNDRALADIKKVIRTFRRQ